MKTTAQLVDELFQAHRRPDGREYTHREVALALEGTINPSYLSKLRTGKITNPGRDTLLALCRFFQVPPAYFFPELDNQVTTAMDAQADLLRVVLRSTGLRNEVGEKLEELIQLLREEQLSDQGHNTVDQ